MLGLVLCTQTLLVAQEVTGEATQTLPSVERIVANLAGLPSAQSPPADAVPPVTSALGPSWPADFPGDVYNSNNFIAQTFTTSTVNSRAAAYVSGVPQPSAAYLRAGGVPPDPMGDVGRNGTYMVAINSALAYYSGSTLLWQASANALLGLDATVFLTDPMIRWDNASSKWYCSWQTQSGGGFWLAVSQGTGPSGSNWTWRVFQFNLSGIGGVDYVSMTVSPDAVLFGVDKPASQGTEVWAAQKTQFEGNVGVPANFTRFTQFLVQPPTGTAVPVVPYRLRAADISGNSLPVGLLIGTDIAANSSRLFIVRVRSIAAPVNFTASTLEVFSNSLRARISPWTRPVAINQANGIALQPLGRHLLHAQALRMNLPGEPLRLWTCHVYGTNATGTATNPTQVDRNAVRWYEIGGFEEPDAAFAVVQQTGDLVDQATTNAVSFINPSVVARASGDMLLGCTGYGSGTSTRKPSVAISGHFGDRAAGITELPEFPIAGTSTYAIGGGRWGDYSVGSLSPDDGSTIWSWQQYAGTDPAEPSSINDAWRIGVVKASSPPPPQVNGSSVTSVVRGQQNVSITLSGLPDTVAHRAFLSPGAGFTNQLEVSFRNGTTVDPTIAIVPGTLLVTGRNQITFSINIEPSAAIGARNIRITNPDRQLSDSTTSLVFSVQAVTPPSFVRNPSSVSTCPGSTATLCAAVIPGNLGTVSFTWQYLNGSIWTNLSTGNVIDGLGTVTVQADLTATCAGSPASATGTILQLTNTSTTTDTARQVRCQAVTGTQTSLSTVSNVTITRRVGAVTVTPSAYALCVGEPFSFQANVVNPASCNLSFEWRRNGGLVIGTAQTLVISNTQLQAAGNYSCRVTIAGGLSIDSPAATVSVTAPILFTTQPPATLAVNESFPISISVQTSTGNGPYQWYRNNIVITNATSRNLLIQSSSVLAAGDYTCRVPAGICGSFVSSNVCRVTVLGPGLDPTYPRSVLLCPGTTGSFSVEHVSGWPLPPQVATYRWLRRVPPASFSAVPNGNTRTLSVAASSGGAEYACEVTVPGSPTLRTVIAVLTTPGVTGVSAFPGITVACGEPIALTAVGASLGSLPLPVWTFESNPAVLATTTTLQVSMYYPNQAGKYRVTFPAGACPQQFIEIRICTADFNGDGDVDSRDLDDFLGFFADNPLGQGLNYAVPGIGSAGGYRCDINHDGLVNDEDLANFLYVYFYGTCW